MNYGRKRLFQLLGIGVVIFLVVYLIFDHPFIVPGFLLYCLAVFIAAYYSRCPSCKSIFAMEKYGKEETARRRGDRPVVEEVNYLYQNECRVCHYQWISTSTHKKHDRYW